MLGRHILRHQLPFRESEVGMGGNMSSQSRSVKAAQGQWIFVLAVGLLAVLTADLGGRLVQ